MVVSGPSHGRLAGTDSFSYTVSNGSGGTATATVWVTVSVPPTSLAYQPPPEQPALPPPPSSPPAAELYCGREVSSFASVVRGTEGSDDLKGTDGDDLVLGFGGRGVLRGKGGNDCLIGGPGDDRMFGDRGQTGSRTATVTTGETIRKGSTRYSAASAPSRVFNDSLLARSDPVDHTIRILFYPAAL